MKNIELIKLATLKDAEYPQEEKYPSGTVVAKGHMWKWTEPKVGEPFYVMFSKLIPSFHTSIVTKIDRTDNIILFYTKNSIYRVNIL